MEWAKKWNADAIIGRCDEDKVGLLGQLNIPIVLQNKRTRSDVYSILTGDYVGNGEVAAGPARAGPPGELLFGRRARGVEVGPALRGHPLAA